MANLLVVDDDPVLLSLIARLLRRAGHAVAEAASGAECLALTQTQTFDVILTDVMMPDQDGYDLTRQLRATLPSPHTRILIFTSRWQGPDADLARAAGADGVLMKTVNVERINTTLADLLNT